MKDALGLVPGTEKKVNKLYTHIYVFVYINIFQIDFENTIIIIILSQYLWPSNHFYPFFVVTGV
jgi:hypothetical protein